MFQLAPSPWTTRVFPLPFLLLSWLGLQAAESFEMSHWHSSIASGSAKETEMAAWGGPLRYDLKQDVNYTLWREGEAVESSPQTPLNKVLLSLYPEDQGRRIWGLGASMTDSSAWVLHRLKSENPELYRMTMERLFCREKGAGFSVIRLVVGASDYIAGDRFYTYCDIESPDLSAFSIDRDHAYLIPVIQHALRLNPDIKFIASPWSAPAWMKTNGSLYGISSQEKAAGATNRLKPEHFHTYARYLTKFIEAYAREGIHVDALTLQNEPQFDSAHYPCMRLTQEDYVALIRELGPMLRERSLKTTLLLHDHNWILHPNDTKVVGGDVKRDPIELVRTLYLDDSIAPYIGGSAWHCYAGNEDDMARVYRSLAQEFPDKLILTTEATAWSSKRSRWANGHQVEPINWIYDIGWGYNHNWFGTFKNGGHASLQWNFALDHTHGPSPREDSYAYGLVTVNTDTWDEVKFEREFYAMAHVSKAMAGGGRFIESSFMQTSGHPYGRAKWIAVERDDGRIGVFIQHEEGENTLELSVESQSQRANVTLEPKTMVSLVLEKDK